jgi:hypothetical protein
MRLEPICVQAFRGYPARAERYDEQVKFSCIRATESP